MKISDLDLQQMKHVLQKIDELEKSDGWKMLKDIMATEREVFFRKMSAPDAVVVDPILNYNRGIIEGTYRMADLPNKLIAELANQITLAQATLNAAQAGNKPVSGSNP